MARNHLLYFGREMTFTDRNGTQFPASFWKLDKFIIDTDRRELVLTYVGWQTKEAFDAGEPSLVASGARREYTFTGEAHDRLIVLYAQAVAAVAQSAWQIAGSVKDTPDTAGVFESFFASAGEILAPPELQQLFNQ